MPNGNAIVDKRRKPELSLEELESPHSESDAEYQTAPEPKNPTTPVHTKRRLRHLETPVPATPTTPPPANTYYPRPCPPAKPDKRIAALQAETAKKTSRFWGISTDIKDMEDAPLDGCFVYDPSHQGPPIILYPRAGEKVPPPRNKKFHHHALGTLTHSDIASTTDDDEDETMHRDTSLLDRMTSDASTASDSSSISSASPPVTPSLSFMHRRSPMSSTALGASVAAMATQKSFLAQTSSPATAAAATATPISAVPALQLR